MTLYTRNKPHHDVLLMDFQYVANLLFPVTLSFLIFHPSSILPPLILPSGQCIRAVREDADIILFPRVITISHRCPVSSHVATLSPLCRRCLRTLAKVAFFKNPLLTLWSLRSGFPQWRDKWLGVLPRSRLKCGGQVTLISAALQRGHRVD